jgi:hypothetical protein
VQRPLTSGPRRWPADQTPWSTDPTLQPLMGLLHGHALQAVVTRNLKHEVSGSWTRWPAGHVARPVSQHLACYELNGFVNSSFDPYKYPLPMEFKIPHSTCSSPLVKVLI